MAAAVSTAGAKAVRAGVPSEDFAEEKAQGEDDARGAGSVTRNSRQMTGRSPAPSTPGAPNINR
jgi:hypothetical protein